MPVSLRQRLSAFLASHPEAPRLTVGYSGGMDSHVLLHLLATRRAAWPERTVRAIHVDHGLQSASAAWSEHCARVCRELAVPFSALAISVQPAPGESPEAAARRARYAALAAEIGPDAALVTAHHRDDQAETLLLQLLRGAGPHGLAAMPARARLGAGWLLRPLLEIDRSELLAYAQDQGLRWVEDASNADTSYDRNYLRHRILPALRQRWPAATRTLARSARWCAETAAWLDQAAEADLVSVAAGAGGLCIPALRDLDEARQRNVLRHWLRRRGLPVPDSRQLDHILRDGLSAARDRQPCVRWPGGEIRRYRDRLYAMPPRALHASKAVFHWRPVGGGYPPLPLPGVGHLRLERASGAGLRAALVDPAGLTVRFRQGGEWFHPTGRRHGQELKKLLQDAAVPPWERDRLPLLYQGSALVAVIGLGIAVEAAASAGETGWLPILEPPLIAIR